MKLTTTSLFALCAAGSALAGPVKNHGKHARLHNHMHRRFDNLTAPSAPKIYGSQGVTVQTTVTVQPIEQTTAMTSVPATDSALVSFSSADGTVQALSPSVNAITRTEVSTATYTVGTGPTASETTNQYEVIITDYVTEYVTVIVEASSGSPAPTSTGSDANISANNHAAPSASSASQESSPAAASAPAANSPAAYTSASPSDAAEPTAYSTANSDSAPEAQTTPYNQDTTMSIMPSALYTNASGAANFTAPHPGVLAASKKTKKHKTKTQINKKVSSKWSPYFSSFTATSTTTLESTTTTKQTSVTTKTQSSSSSSSSQAQSSSVVSSSSVKSSSSSAAPSTSSIKTSTPASSSSTTAAAVTAPAPAPTGTGTVSGCTEWYVVQSGDYCSLVASKFGLDLNTFYAWNPSVDPPSCSALQLGYAYCVATTGAPVVSTTSAAASTIPAGYSTTASSASASTPTGSYAYQMYSGNGTVAAGWPAMSQWLDFETMWNFNVPIMQQSCTQWNVPNNSPQEIADMKTAINTISGSSGVDARFILAIIMQESNGCVRVITTNYGVNNPGLMQDHDGSGSCNIGGVVQTPCPASEITQMITDGTEGTSSGDGLKQCIAESSRSDVSMYYAGARIYNGGFGGYHPDNLGTGCCTLCYSSDVANRLTGWHSGPSGCTL